MLKKMMLAMLLMGFSYTAFANWVGGFSYHHFMEEDNGVSIDVAAVVGSLGYKVPMENNFYMIPEVRVGFGVREDVVSLSGNDIEVGLDGLFIVSLKAQREFDNNLYVFVAPSYGNVDVTASAYLNGQNFSGNDNTWVFGIGSGLGYRFSENMSAELSYESFEGTGAISAGLKVNF